MSDEAALLYAESVLKLLLRAGIVNADDVLAMADEHDLIATRQPDEADDRGEAAHLLRCTVMHADAPSAVDPAVEYRAMILRRQMVERTRLIDGGNDPT